MLGDHLPVPSQLPSPVPAAVQLTELNPSARAEMRRGGRRSAALDADEGNCVPNEAAVTPPSRALPLPAHRRLQRQATGRSTSSAATDRQERAAIKIQSAARGRWVRKAGLAKDLIVVQQAAVNRLRVERRRSHPGRLEASNGHPGVFRDAPPARLSPEGKARSAKCLRL